MACTLRHDGAIAAARGSVGGGRFLNRVSSRAVQLRKQNHSWKAQGREEVAPGAGPSPALPPQAGHAVLDRMQRKGEQVQRGEQVGQALAAVPEVALEVEPWRARQLNPSFSIFQRARPASAIAATLSAVTSRLVKNVFV